ncbi:hypothetical protein ES705_50389 [subsurface metagenome]
MQAIVTKVCTDSYWFVFNNNIVPCRNFRPNPLSHFTFCCPGWRYSSKLNFKLKWDAFLKFGSPCVHPYLSQVISDVSLPECFPYPLDIGIIPAPDNVSGQDNPVFGDANEAGFRLELLPRGDPLIYHRRANPFPFQNLLPLSSYQPAFLAIALHILLLFQPGQLLARPLR